MSGREPTDDEACAAPGQTDKDAQTDALASSSSSSSSSSSPSSADPDAEATPAESSSASPPFPVLPGLLAANSCAQSWTHHSLFPAKSHVDVEGASATVDHECLVPNTPVVLGVDEAGRGPVLGPMVYAYAIAPVSRKDQVKGLGVDDSKKVKESDREDLFIKMTTEEDYPRWVGWGVTVMSPRDISEGMLRRTKYNLNEQAYDTTVALIRETLKRGVNVTEIYVDTVGKEKTYQAYLESHFPGISITVASKADSKYPIVSAASIFAKVTRDYVVKNWEFIERGSFSRVFGSGYPGDPNTKAWLRDNLDPIFGYPNIIRFSWSTTAKRLEKHCVPVQWMYDESPGDKGLQSVTSFFKPIASSTKGNAIAKSAEPSSAASSDESSGDEDENVADSHEAMDEADAIEAGAGGPRRSTRGKKVGKRTLDADVCSDEEAESKRVKRERGDISVAKMVQRRNAGSSVLDMDALRSTSGNGVWRGLALSHIDLI